MASYLVGRIRAISTVSHSLQSRPLPAPLASLASDLDRIADARHHDPHSILGEHGEGSSAWFLAYLPSVSRARLTEGPTLERVGDSDFFFTLLAPDHPRHHSVIWEDARGRLGERITPYDFAPSLSGADLALFASGRHLSAWRMLGAHPATFEGVAGVRFAVWAPNAERASVVGGFCEWDGRRLPMRALGGSGVWELFVPDLPTGEIYKFELRTRDGQVLLKTDPYALAMELRPSTASIVTGDDAYHWQDDAWMQARRARDWLHAPLSIYEVHLGSWQRHPDGRFLSYRELAAELIPYVQRLGFTHLELLPITEHPLDDSWGYQTTGYFAPTRRFGTPDDLRYFIDQCHLHGIGVLLDWVPGHFPRDAHGLGRFDGTALYEYADPRKGEHQDWGTYIFNYDRFEVQSFLLASACFWLEEFHFDGLRVDAVASMLYLDYARGGDFVRNRYGGNQNLEAIEFLRELNAITHSRAPGTIVVAEESTSWPMVSRPVDVGGLGFSMKWNMGWMHDTLAYFTEDPVYRSHHHSKLTFGMMYAYSENFVLPLSHDEVVHLKRSLLGRMPGDRWQQMANLRALYVTMWTMPGKKLLFMGGEIGHPWEWDFRHGLPWFLMEYPEHQGVQKLIGDLNRLYVAEPALHSLEFDPAGFEWLDCNDAANSTLTFLRKDAHGAMLVVALNFTPVPRPHFRIGVPRSGSYHAVLNSDSEHYGGGNLGDLVLDSRSGEHGGHPYYLELTLPPLAGVVLKRS